MTTKQKKSKSSKFFLVAALGALAGVLFAPRSGKETRTEIGRQSKKYIAKGKRAFDKAEREGKKYAARAEVAGKKYAAYAKARAAKVEKQFTKEAAAAE